MGSEMCIRDRHRGCRAQAPHHPISITLHVKGASWYFLRASDISEGHMHHARYNAMPPGTRAATMRQSGAKYYGLQYQIASSIHDTPTRHKWSSSEVALSWHVMLAVLRIVACSVLFRSFAPVVERRYLLSLACFDLVLPFCATGRSDCARCSSRSVPFETSCYHLRCSSTL